MIKDLTFLSPVDERVKSVLEVKRTILEQEQKLIQLRREENQKMIILKMLIIKKVISGIKDKNVRDFLGLPAYVIDYGPACTTVRRQGNVLRKISQINLTDEEIRFGDIWDTREYHYVNIASEDVRSLGLITSEKSLAAIFRKIKKVTEGNIELSFRKNIIEQFGKTTKRFISIQAVNRILLTKTLKEPKVNLLSKAALRQVALE